MSLILRADARYTIFPIGLRLFEFIQCICQQIPSMGTNLSFGLSTLYPVIYIGTIYIGIVMAIDM